MYQVNVTRQLKDLNPNTDTLVDVVGTLFSMTNYNKVWIVEGQSDWADIVIFTDADDECYQQITYHLSIDSIFLIRNTAIQVKAPIVLRGDAHFMGVVPDDQHHYVVNLMQNLDSRHRYQQGCQLKPGA
jgi:hypothetical protein